jgi:ATP/maltotriose-dependent transcriptional regulator MalT
MHLLEEGIQLAKEALEVYVRLNDTVNQGQCLLQLAQLLHSDNQLDAAEETASRAITLLPEDDHQFIACGCHRVLGNIYHFKGDEAKAIEHLEVALRIASSHDNWNSTTFWIYYTMVVLYSEEGRIGDAYAHLERAKPHALNDAHNSAYAMVLQAYIWYYECRLEEAESEALRALDAFEKLGATEGVERCRRVISKIREEMKPVPLIDLT